MAWFSFGRSEGFPTQYEAKHTPASIDVVTTTLIICLLILTISLFAILPAYGKQKRRSLLLRIVLSLFIGGVVLVGNYGHNWEIATLKISTPYKPSSHEEIQGTIGLHISLRGINITLKGRPLIHAKEKSSLLEERIDYNEHFSWEWKQGRFGFGYYAGQISKDFRAASERGVPLPILQVAEYFTFDGEGIRFGRYYRLAGWYSHILMWSAFATWLVANILFCMIVSSATYFLIATGALQLMAVGVWTLVRNPIEIQIPFQTYDGSGDVLLKTRFGLDYYLILGNGMLCLLLGATALVLNSCWPDEMCGFFGIDPLTIYDELLLSKDELEEVKGEDEVNLMELGKSGVSIRPDVDGDDLGSSGSKKVSFYGDGDEQQRESTVVLKRRTNVGSKLFRKSFRVKPKPAPRVKPKLSEVGVTRALLSPNANQGYQSNSSDEEGTGQSWPPPPRESVLKKPPTPPPKRRIN